VYVCISRDHEVYVHVSMIVCACKSCLRYVCIASHVYDVYAFYELYMYILTAYDAYVHALHVYDMYIRVSHPMIRVCMLVQPMICMYMHVASMTYILDNCRHMICAHIHTNTCHVPYAYTNV